MSSKKRENGHTYYPLFMDLENRLCVVVGGGRVAERKVRALLSASARVRVVSPRLTKGLVKLQERGKIDTAVRPYRKGDLAGAALVVAATDSDEVHRKVRAESTALSIPLNVVDNPPLCDFIVPAVVRKGPIIIAISTSGSLPMLSKKLRQEVMERLSDDYVTYANRVGRFRAFVIAHVKDAGRRQEIMRRVAALRVAEVTRMTVKEMKERFLPLNRK